jgi:glucose/arabinose dehydrogenase
MVSTTRCAQAALIVVVSTLLIFGVVFTRDRVSATVPAPKVAETSDRAVAAFRLAGPFEYPWCIAFLPDDTILITEKPGRLRLIRPGAAPKSVAGVPPVLHKGQGGLLDIAVDPAFSQNGMVYLSYSHGSEEHSSIRVLRAKLDLANNALIEHQIIFESTPSATTEQLGGRIALSGDGHLFLTLGTRWQAKRAQDLSDDAGKIIRIRTDGSIPADNPFSSVPGTRPEIWSYGHRNPQGLTFDASGRLWSTEHGPLGGDELNLIVAGRNYGWPVITHGVTYSGERFGEGTEKEGMEQPIRHWSPSVAPSGLAVQVSESMTFVYVAALADESLIVLELGEDGTIQEQRWLGKDLGRIRDVRIGPDRSLYLIVDDVQGSLYRLHPASDQARAPGP